MLRNGPGGGGSGKSKETPEFRGSGTAVRSGQLRQNTAGAEALRNPKIIADGVCDRVESRKSAEIPAGDRMSSEDQ